MRCSFSSMGVKLDLSNKLARLGMQSRRYVLPTSTACAWCGSPELA
ncbi:hypothetical protein EE612_049025 [Oryza sativa]|nr:hypothetical protein EE612_049025 [Oryza sativa]